MDSAFAVTLAFAAGALVGGALVARRLRAQERSREIREGEAARSRSERLARTVAILNALPDSFFVLADDDRVLELKIARRAGRKAAMPRLTNVTLRDLFPSAIVDVLRAERDACVDADAIRTRDVELEFAGARRSYEMRIARADAEHVVVLLRDVTDVRLGEKFMITAKEHAEALLAARTEYMARTGHDLRNAMTGVLGMTDILLGTNDDPSARRYLELIQRSGEHFVTLVRDMVEFTRLERGRMPIVVAPVDLRGLFEDAIGFHTGAAESAGLALSLEVDGLVPDRVSLDGARVRQILDNLVGNALKFTERGSVVVRLAHRDGAIEFSVVDTGRGIPKDAADHVFDAFVQVEGADEATQRGSGLGLAIVKQLVDAMGGSVRLDSEVGVGSTFRVRIPAPAVTDTEAATTRR